MKNLFTLAASAALTVASLGAQAQFTVDGTLAPAEIGTGLGKYQLVGTYTNTHSVANRGLKALYMGTTATTVNFMVVASPEKTDYCALLLFLDTPNRTGTAAGTRLAGGDDTSSQFKRTPTLDMPMDFGFRLTVSPLGGSDVNAYHSKIDYTVAPNAAGKYHDVYLGSTDKQGNAFVITDAASGVLGGKISYKTSATGSVSANTTTGWEIEYPLAALGGAVTNDLFRVMVAYVSDPGDFYSDLLPQVAGQTTDLGADPNFFTIARNQNYTYQVGSGPLASRTASAALQASVSPNPVTAASHLDYTVTSGNQPVSVEVYNNLGQRVLNVLNTTQPAGNHSVDLASLQGLASGTYLVKLQAGNQLTTSRVLVK